MVFLEAGGPFGGIGQTLRGIQVTCAVWCSSFRSQSFLGRFAVKPDSKVSSVFRKASNKDTASTPLGIILIIAPSPEEA